MEASENIMKVDDSNAGFLSAAELVQIRKSNEEPARSNIGEKFYIRENNWMESKAVECALENYTDSLKQNRAARKCDLIQAKWNEELNVSIATKLKGKFLQHMGFAYDGKVALSPEESIFLLENRCIEISNGEMPLSTEEAYKVMLKEDLSTEKYQVYSQLSQLGFIVVSHRKGLGTKPSKRKRKSSTEIEMYQKPEKKRTTFLGALSNLPDTTLHSAKEGSYVPETASEVIISTSDSVSQECVAISMTPPPLANNKVPKSSKTQPVEAVTSESYSIITDSIVVSVDNSNPSILELNDKVIEEKSEEKSISVNVNNLGGESALLSANSVKGDGPRVSVEGSEAVRAAASDKSVCEKELSVQSERSNSDPCCIASSNNVEVDISEEGSKKINTDVNSNGDFSKEISVQLEDSESCCEANSNSALLNFKATVSGSEKDNTETNNAVEKDFSSKEISMQIRDSGSCNVENLNTAQLNIKSTAGVSEGNIEEVNNTVNNNVFSPKEISVQIDDSKSCDTNSNPVPSSFKADISVSEEGSKELNNAPENNPVLSSIEEPVQIEDSDSCNEANLKDAVQVSNSAQENNTHFSSKETPVQIEDSDSCNEANSNPSNFEAAVRKLQNAQENNLFFSSKEKPVQIEDSDSCNEANSNLEAAVEVLNDAQGNNLLFSSKEKPVQIEDSDSCNEASSNFEAAVRVSNNAIDIMNLDSGDTEVSCSSEVLGKDDVCEDWRMDARSQYDESNSDVMSCSSNEDDDDEDDDVLSVGVGEEKLEDDEVELVAVTKKETKPLAVIDLLSDSETTSESQYNESDDEIQVVKVCEGVRLNDQQHPRSSVIHSAMKCKKEEKPSGTISCDRLQVKFPQCAHQNIVIVTRPPSMYLPSNVVLAKESYTLTFPTCQAQARRVWNSYRDLQSYQMPQRPNHRTEEFPSRNFKSNFQQSRFNSSGGYNSNSWSQNSSTNLEGNSFPWLNPARNSPQGFSHYPTSLPPNNFNRNDTQSPDSRLSNSRSSNLNELPPNPSVNPFNPLPNFQNQYRFPPPNATAINSVVSVSNQDMNVRMVGNHILHPPRPFMPMFDGNVDPRDIMAAVQRTAYSVATDVLSSMFGPNLPSHILPRIPFAGMPAQNGANSFGLPQPQNVPFGNPNFGHDPLTRRQRQRLRRNYSSNPFPCQYRNVNNRLSWNEVREAVGEQDMELDVGSDVEEVPLNPTDVLWDPAGICPLVKPGVKLPPAEILKKLQVTKMANLRSNTPCNQVCLPTTCSLEISFDVYLPGTNYRKTSPGIPKHRIIVMRSTDPLPKYADIVFLQNKWNDGATLQIAVVDNGDISFQSFNNVCLTVLVPHEM